MRGLQRQNMRSVSHFWIFGVFSVIALAESVFSEYLRENESFSKTILACLSGAQVGSIHDKKMF